MKKLIIIFLLSFCSSALAYSNGDVMAIRIVGSTTGVSDATSACNASSACTGWVAEVDIYNLASGGTYALGMGTNNSPATANLVCTTSSSAFDASGNATTATRTIYGTHQLRKVYNSGYTPPYPNDETVVSTTTTLRIALSDFIYSSDTSVSCNVASGLYTKSGTGSNAATGVSVTNSSALAYPKAIANWSWPGFSRITGSTFTVRAVGYHRHAKNGKPLAAMIFTATDAHSHSNSVTVNNMTIDSSVPDAVKVQEYIGTISTTGFTQGDLITVNFKAVPWIGDTNAVMDTSDGANSMPTPLYAPQYYIFDGSGTYGTAATVVDGTNGVDATCQADSEANFNGSSDLATTHPCLTIDKAASLMRAYNNTNSSRADAAGTMYMKAGNYNWTGASNSYTISSQNVWTTVTTFPAVAKASVVINGQSGNQSFGAAGKVKLNNITINVASAPTSIWSGFTYLWFNGVSLTANGTAPIYIVTDYYITDSSVGAMGHGLISYAGTNSNPVLIRGNNVTGFTNQAAIYTVLGNINTSVSSSFTFENEYSGQQVASIQPIFAYNAMYRYSVASSSAMSMMYKTAGVLGAAIIQNVFENNYTNETQAMVGVSADGSTSITPNVMLWHNTMVGGRINRAYNDTGSSLVLKNLWSEVGELRDQEAIKSDTFGTPNAGRVGNWAELFGVGRMGCYNAEVSGGSTGFIDTGNFQMEFGGLYSYNPIVNYGIQPVGSATNAVNVIAYASRQAFDGTNANNGEGNYALASSSPAISMIPSGQAVLPYDIAGNIRKNDGTGASGAYEYYLPASLTISGVTMSGVNLQ